MDATDTSGNDNHGYYGGDFSGSNESWRTGGAVNGRMAFYFDGNDDELTVTNIGNPQGAWPHSVSVWVSPSQFNGVLYSFWVLTIQTTRSHVLDSRLLLL